MAVKGEKIEFVDSTLIRRIGKYMVCDPNVAKIYVAKGLAVYCVKKEIGNESEEKGVDKEVVDNVLEIKLNKEKKKDNDSIFPKEIIA